MASHSLVLTGSRGRLGRSLLPLLPACLPLTRADLDITDAEAVEKTFRKLRPRVVLHAAAFTDQARAEVERQACWACNVEGTQNIVRAAGNLGCRVVFVSTDYVFSGERGGYREAEPPGPPCNYYSLTKLAAETAVLTLPDSLVVRTSFRPRPWPHPVAFTDLFTSQDYLDVIAPEFALLMNHLDQVPSRILHLGTERKSYFELARRSRPEVKPALRAEVSLSLPADVSLDCSRWNRLKERLRLASARVG